MSRMMGFQCEIRVRTSFDRDAVDRSRMRQAVLQDEASRIRDSVLEGRSEVEKARDALFGNVMTTDGENEEIERRLAPVRDAQADPVEVFRSNVQAETERAVEGESEWLQANDPGFRGVFNFSAIARTERGVFLNLAGLEAVMERMSLMGRIRQAVGLSPRPGAGTEVVDPYVSVGVRCMLEGVDADAAERAGERLRRALAAIGSLHDVSSHLFPDTSGQPSFEERVRDRAPLPPLGEECLGLIESVATALKAGDEAGAFDAAEAFADLLRRSPDLASLIPSSRNPAMQGAVEAARGDVARATSIAVAGCRARGDADGIADMFFDLGAVGEGILPRLMEVSQDRTYDVRPTRPLYPAHERVFGEAGNAMLHLVAFSHDRKTAPSGHARRQAAERAERNARLQGALDEAVAREASARGSAPGMGG